MFTLNYNSFMFWSINILLWKLKAVNCTVYTVMEAKHTTVYRLSIRTIINSIDSLQQNSIQPCYTGFVVKGFPWLTFVFWGLLAVTMKTKTFCKIYFLIFLYSSQSSGCLQPPLRGALDITAFTILSLHLTVYSKLLNSL